MTEKPDDVLRAVSRFRRANARLVEFRRRAAVAQLKADEALYKTARQLVLLMKKAKKASPAYYEGVKAELRKLPEGAIFAEMF